MIRMNWQHKNNNKPNSDRSEKCPCIEVAVGIAINVVPSTIECYNLVTYSSVVSSGMLSGNSVRPRELHLTVVPWHWHPFGHTLGGWHVSTSSVQHCVADRRHPPANLFTKTSPLNYTTQSVFQYSACQIVYRTCFNQLNQCMCIGTNLTFCLLQVLHSAPCPEYGWANELDGVWFRTTVVFKITWYCYGVLSLYHVSSSLLPWVTLLTCRWPHK